METVKISRKRKILNTYGVYYNNYFTRGGNALANPVQIILLLMDTMALYVAKSAWYFYPISISVIIFAFAIAIAYGWFDYGGKGTRKIETLNAAKSEIQTVIYGEILDLQLRIINKLNNSEDKTPIEITEKDKEIFKFISYVNKDNGFDALIKADNGAHK